MDLEGLIVPELPEVETTRRGVAPYLENRRILSIKVHNANLRWEVPERLMALSGEMVRSLSRRGKYLILSFDSGATLIHLGMSGSLRIVANGERLRKHDHIEWILDGGHTMRFHDPRRFGCVLWSENWREHDLIRHLGPEPLSDDFDASYLYSLAKGRKTPIKSLIMNAQVVVGVGNIYANEALFLSGIHPGRQAGRISRKRFGRLVGEIKAVLNAAITQGGTTLRDFVDSDGNPGYFKQQLYVYGRGGLACKQCGSTLREMRQNQRATVFCSRCQR